MNDKKFQDLLDKAMKSAREHRKLMQLVGDVCIERFGYHYSDLDIDVVIDAVDHGVGHVAVKDVVESYEWAIENRKLK